jgi:hypothetical protein
MSLDSFERVPLFGPARPAERAPRRRGRDLGEARGLQLGPRVRRQQDAEAGVPRRRRSRTGLRHSRLDRWRPVESHAPGRRGRREARPRLCPSAGALGRVAGCRLRQGRQHPALADHGRRRAARSRGGRHRIRPSWEEALASVEERGGKPYAIPAGASDHPLGGLGFARWAQEVAEQEAELGVFFDTIVVCSVTGSTQAGMIAGFALQDTERKVLGIDGSATVDQTWNQIASAANSATTRSSCSTSGTPAPTGSRTRRRSRPSACALGSRGCHRSGVRGGIDGGAD